MKALLIFVLATLGVAFFLSRCTILLEDKGEKSIIWGSMNDYAWVMDGFSEESHHFFIDKVDGEPAKKKAKSFGRYLPAIMLSPGKHTLEVRKEKLVGVQEEEERITVQISVEAGGRYILISEGGVLELRSVIGELLSLANQPLQTDLRFASLHYGC